MPRTIPADLRLYYLQRPPPQVAGVQLQSYFPSLEVLFPSLVEQSAGSPTLAAQELIVDLSSNGLAVVENLVTKARRITPTWIRQMHLVEPIDVMSGDYVLPGDGALPASRGPWQRALRKLNDPYNEAYTDAVCACMASRLVETGRSPHFARFYGTYNGRVPEYRYNITEDMPEVEGERWFAEGLQSGAFRIIAQDPWDPEVTAEVTRPWEDVRRKLDAAADELSLSDSGSDDDDVVSETDGSIVSVTESVSDTESDAESQSIGDKTPSATPSMGDSDIEEADIEVSGSAEIVRPRLRLARVQGSAGNAGTGTSSSGSSGSGGSGGGSGGSDESEDDVEYRALLKNYPVQFTVLERCDGTLDDLMEDEIADDATADMQETKEQRWTAWIFQVIAGLAAAQQTYDLVHNDLHTNNVMWCGTGETHLYYHVTGSPGGDRFYRVPTYGRIMKIIDFGRATFRASAATGDNRIWFPDAYAPGADAAGQYNCGQYFEQGKPKVQPNKSFDLCRLAVAMLETLWPSVKDGGPEVAQPRKVLTREPGRVQAETVSPLWNLLWLWLTDNQGRNVLRSPDGSERYPDFNLYCAIASDVHNAVPAQQLTLPLFDGAFRCRRRDIPADAKIWKLQAVAKH
jgi:hypothetical protein